MDLGRRLFRAAFLWLSLLLLACGGSRETAPPPAAPEQIQPPGQAAFLPAYQGKPPVDGGTFTRPLPVEPVTLNPVVASDQVSFLVYKWIFDPLIDMNEKMEPTGVLARSWEVSPDGRTLTFHLREGVSWHDGKPFTADDVLFTYRACMDPTVDAVNKRPTFAEVQSVEAPDPLTVVVKWKVPYAPGLAAWVLYIMPRHLYDFPAGKGAAFNLHPLNARPVGTGPFRFVEWRRGEAVVLEANPSYFRGRPHLDRVVFRVLPQAETQLAAYRTGTLDMTGLGPEQWEAVKRDPGFWQRSSVFEYPARQFYYIGWNLDGSVPLLADRKVRKALALALNRKGVVDRILGGHGALLSGPFYPDGWESNPSVSPLPYDPAAAARLLDEAGWTDHDGDGLRDRGGKPCAFECLVPAEVEMFSRWLEVFQQDLRKVGVDMRVRQLEWGVFLDRTHRHRFEAYLSGWSLGDDPDPFQLLHSSQGKLLPSGVGVGQNDGSYANAEVDRLIEEQQRTFDRQARQRALWRIHKIVAEDQPHAYLFLGTQITAVGNRFQNVKASRAGYGLFTWYPSLLEWWVPKELQ